MNNIKNTENWKEEAHKINNEYFLESVKKQHKLMESFSYKGYKGTAKIDLTDNALYGKILYIPNLVVYSSNTVKGLRAQFEHSVDWYIEQLSTTFGEITNSFNMSFDEEE